MGLRMALGNFMSKSTDLSARGASAYPSLLSSLFERMQVRFILESAVDRSTTGCWKRSFIAKTLLPLTGKHLAPLVKGRIWEADIQTLDRLGRKM